MEDIDPRMSAEGRGAGEREAIQLAVQVLAPVQLADDQAARGSQTSDKRGGHWNDWHSCSSESGGRPRPAKTFRQLDRTIARH